MNFRSAAANQGGWLDLMELLHSEILKIHLELKRELFSSRSVQIGPIQSVPFEEREAVAAAGVKFWGGKK